MANTEMIRDYIRASGYKMQYVARALKISPNALNLKLQGRTQFKLSEAERLERGAWFEHVRAGSLLF